MTITDFRGRKYLVTGGAGFIGHALALALVERGAEVVVLDRADEIRALNDPHRFRCFAGDVAAASTYEELSRLAPFDAVFHLAAQTSGRVSHETPEVDVATNAQGTLLLVEWCRRVGIQRFLYASSMAVYGNPERLPVNESAHPLPISYYGITKLAGEHYVRANVPAGLRPTSFRMFNVYGPGQNMRNLKQGMARVYMAYVLREQTVPITGSLQRFRDFVFIDDVVNAWLLALNDERAINKIYNVGSGTPTTVRQLLDVIIRAAGHSPADYPVEEVASHAGDQFGMQADASALQRDLGWRPRVVLADGIARMTAWARQAIEAEKAAKS